MAKNKNPAPRANAGSRAISKVEREQNTPSWIDWEAEAATVWWARRLPMSAPLAPVLTALASLGRAVG